MYKKMLILLLAGFCTVFFVVGSVGYYIQFFAENESFRLGKEFGEKYSDEIWLRSKNHTMEYIEALTVARAGEIDAGLEDVNNDVQFLANTMTRIASRPENYRPRNVPFDKPRSNEPFIRFSEEILSDRSPELESEVAIAANIADVLKDLHRNYATKSSGCYVASKNGYFICVEANVSGNETYEPFDARQRIWYREAQLANKVIFSENYVSTNGNGAFTCAAPYYSGKDFAGVVGIGCDMGSWYDLLINDVIPKGGLAFLLDGKGKVVLSTEDTGLLAVTVSDNDLTRSPDEKVVEMAKEMTSGKIGIEEVEFDGKDYFVSFAPLRKTGWSLALLIPTSEVTLIADNMREDFSGHLHSLREKIRDEYSQLTILSGMCLLMILALMVTASRQLARKFVAPIGELTENVKEISAGNLDKKLDISTGDEIQALAENFNIMTNSIKTQMSNLAKVTAEKERISAELEVATNIQRSMLPKKFLLDGRIEISARMTPAKQVGGDLYDFFKLDENHLFVTIADVSGKGVPAALFMVATITNLRNAAASLKNPEDLKTAIENTNSNLCANNEDRLFATAFSGVIDLAAGKFLYVSAGHNPPLLRRCGKHFEELFTESNVVLGCWEDWKYVQQEIQLEKGDTLFLYTDGVTEASDPAGNMYSLGHLKEVLNGLGKDLSAEEILQEIQESLQEFAKDAEQSDDITMFAIKF